MIRAFLVGAREGNRAAAIAGDNSISLETLTQYASATIKVPDVQESLARHPIITDIGFLAGGLPHVLFEKSRPSATKLRLE